jgi:hypothetical protein
MGAVNERATRRNNYPVRVALPASRPAVSVPAGASRGRAVPVRPSMGDFLATAFPQTAAAMRNSKADQDAAWAKGDVARTVGASLRQMATVPAGLVYDATVPTLSALWRGGGAMLGGLLSSDGSDDVTKAYTPPATAPVKAALAAGRAAPANEMTPQEKLMREQLDAAIRRPMTLRGATAVAGLLPERGTAPSAKDRLLETTGSVSESVYANEVKTIAAAHAAGKLNLEEAQAATKKATDAFFLRNTALVANPLNYMQANMLAPTEEE